MFTSKIQSIFWTAVIFLLIMVFTASVKDVQWCVKQLRIELGKPLNLTCQFSSTISTKLIRQWTIGKHNRLLCQDNVTFIRTKYEGRINSPTEYVLTIFDLTEHDLEYVYSCRIGFQYDQKQIKLDKLNFVHKPETTAIKYEMLNGNYSLRLEFSQVFPKPLCRVKLNGEYKNLTIAHEKQPRVLYTVVYVLQSTEALHSCGKTVNIECDIGRQKLNISQKHDLDCKTLDETKTTILTYLAITVSITAFFVVILVYYIYKRHQKSRRHGKEYIPTKSTCIY